VSAQKNHDPIAFDDYPDPLIHPQMILNDAGQMIEKWYHKIEDKFPGIRCHEMIVMPNHFHCFIENTGTTADVVGADPCVCPVEHMGSPLHCVVRWFKTMTTNEYIRGVKNKNWSPFDGKLWQRDYWEHIIRNNKSYQTISEYILNNPLKWAEDDLYIK
jgi:putative transposase